MGGTSAPWPLEGRNQDRQEFSVVGTWGIPGRQAWDMASGAAQYPRDLHADDMLHGAALRSPYGHTKVTILDTSEAEKLDGVVLVLTHKDEELAAMPKVMPSWWELGASPLLPDEAEWEGQEVGAIVVAKTPEICQEALKLIKVKWEVLPHILDPREAAKTGAPILRPDMNEHSNLAGNTFGAPNAWEDGNVDEGFKQADHIIEFDYGWPMWSQMRPMPGAYFAYWAKDPYGNPEKDTLYTINASHYPNIGALASARCGLGLTEDRIRGLSPYLGGRYCDLQEKRGAQFAPLLSKRVGHPVRWVYTRRDAFDANVPASYFHTKIGFTENGTLTAVHNHNIHQSGARGGYGDQTQGHLVLPPGSTGFRATVCPNILHEHEQMVTNGASTTADPGSNRWEPINRALYEIAVKLGKDPIDITLQNLHTTKPSLEACVEAGKKAFGWDEKFHQPGARKLEDGRMHGVAFRPHNAMTWGMISYSITVTLRPDGKFYVPYMESLMGTYWPDAVAMVVAEELGAKVDDVKVFYSPNLNSWVNGDASDKGAGATWTAKEAANLLRDKLFQTAAGMLKVSVDMLEAKDSAIGIKGTEYSIPYASGYYGQVSAAFVGRPTPYDDSLKTLRTMNGDFLEVAVDTETGMVEILDYVAAHDFGKVIRPSSALGQIEQALTMSCGGGLREEVIWDENTGVLLNGNLYEYKPTTYLDQPSINVVPVETRSGGGCYGATGTAHSHFDRGLFAQAIHNATGAWVETAPATPDKVLAALGKI